MAFSPRIKVVVDVAPGKVAEQEFKPAFLPLTQEDLNAAWFEIVDQAVEYVYSFSPEMPDDQLPDPDTHRREREEE